MPSVSKWIEEANQWIRSGSQVLVQGNTAMNPDSAPTAFSVARGGDYARERHAREPFNLISAMRRDNELIVHLPTEKMYQDAVVKTPVLIRDKSGNPARNGVLCLDRADPKLIRRLIESRRERQTYLSWLWLLMEALPHADAMARARERDVQELTHTYAKAPERVQAAIPDAVTALRDGKPADHQIDPLKAIKLARAIARAKSGGEVDADQVRVRATAAVVRIDRDFDDLATQLNMPILSSRPIKGGDRRIIPFSHIPEIGETIIHSRIAPEDTHIAWKAQTPGVSTPNDYSALLQITDESHGDRISSYLSRNTSIEEDFIVGTLDDVVSHNRRISSKTVEIPAHVLPVGLVNARTLLHNTQIFLIRIRFNPTIHAIRSGREDMVEDFCQKIYAHPKRGMERLRQAAFRRPALCLQYVSLSNKLSLSEVVGNPDGEMLVDKIGLWNRLETDPIVQGWFYFGRSDQGPRRQIEIPADPVGSLLMNVSKESHHFWSKQEELRSYIREGMFIGPSGVRESLQAFLRGENKTQAPKSTL